jgi:putative chitinase
MLTVQMLRQIMPRLSAEKAREYLPFLIAGMEEFKINNELRIAAYLSQLAHESNQLTRWVENLNYSAGRLTEVWSNRFPTLASAQPFAKNPQALANRVYNGRMGNRSGSDDGWKYRGRMPMQATGRDMYELLSDLLGIDLLTNPDLCLKPEIAFRASAAIFARVKNCNQLADGLIHHPANFKIITKRINGGYNGLEDRLEYYRRARRVLPDNIQISGDEIVFAAPQTNQSAEPQTFDGFSGDEIDLLADTLNPTDEVHPTDILPLTTNTGDNETGGLPANSSSVSAFNPQTNPSDSSAPAGDAPNAAARTFLSIEDWKPWVFGKLKALWGLITGLNFAQIPAFATAAYGSGDKWWIWAVVAAVIIIATIFIGLIISLILLAIWYFNRKEIVHYKTLATESRLDPTKANLGLTIERIESGFPGLLRSFVPSVVNK